MRRPGGPGPGSQTARSVLGAFSGPSRSFVVVACRFRRLSQNNSKTQYFLWWCCSLGQEKKNTVFASGSPHPQVEPFSGWSPQVDLPGWICLEDVRWCCRFWFRGQLKNTATSHSCCSILQNSKEETPPPYEGLIHADVPGRTSLHGVREAEKGLREVVVPLTLGNFLSTATPSEAVVLLIGSCLKT